MLSARSVTIHQLDHAWQGPLIPVVRLVCLGVFYPSFSFVDYRDCKLFSQEYFFFCFSAVLTQIVGSPNTPPRGWHSNFRPVHPSHRNYNPAPPQNKDYSENKRLITRKGILTCSVAFFILMFSLFVLGVYFL